MLFIDDVALMLLNAGGAFLLLAVFLLTRMGGAEPRRWAAPFAASTLVALCTGLQMVFVFPLPGPYNQIFGECTVMLGTVLAALALSVGMGWSLLPVGLYGLVAALLPLALGLRIVTLKLTLAPLQSGTGFVLSGVGALFAALTFILSPKSPQDRCSGFHACRVTGGVALLLAAALWILVGILGAWGHAEHFGKWKPSVVVMTPPPEETQK